MQATHKTVEVVPYTFTVPIVEASTIPQPLSLQEKAGATALRHNLSTTTFSNLIYSESRWNPDIPDNNTNGSRDRGLMQISKRWHPEVDDTCAYDVDCAMDWTAAYIEKHGWDEWVPCNCYLYAETIVGPLPLAQYIKPNTTAHVGAIAILNFNGVIHYQVVTGFDKTGYFYDGANRVKCLVKHGHDDWGDSRLVGFYDKQDGT